MREITLEELLEAGCHFGHQVTRQNPRARDFVFEARDNIHIIDLAKTKEELEDAAKFLRQKAANGGVMVIVGTKRQAKPIVEELIKKLKDEGTEGVFSVTNRWIGGTLTNFSEVAKNYKKLKDLKKRLLDEEEKAKFTKKEVGDWAKEKTKLESFYGGMEDIDKAPDVLFVIDTHLEEIAVKEARMTGVPTVGIVDTNADPTMVDFAIPANDDAVGSVQLITSYILDAWKEGKKEGLKVSTEEKEKKGEAASAESSGEPKEEPKAKRGRKPKAASAESSGEPKGKAVETSPEKIADTKKTKKMSSKKKLEETALAE